MLGIVHYSVWLPVDRVISSLGIASYRGICHESCRNIERAQSSRGTHHLDQIGNLSSLQDSRRSLTRPLLYSKPTQLEPHRDDPPFTPSPMRVFVNIRGIAVL
ncbi:hypothetical protein HYDPIDRAFT_117534 [Hydnomerulius pinastri MD-312]|uniref:Uncharacterized protein n=1 Tax=Hydnomerulius pinastri MD-312 TaxID=994086 RepID=A0A0C9W2P2_9AGAM|nr:hypothetical protein HYDPIDRAFT_117534 [Hydnomerulius pinastri MD-312]